MASRKKLKPFTLEHFEQYASNIVLDTNDYWQIEDFQAEIVEPLFAGIREVWAVVPEGNAKTTLIAGVGLYYCDYTPLPWIPIGASSRGQAEIVAKQAYQMIRQSPYMLRRFRIYEGYRRITPIRPDHPARGSHGIEVYAADVTTGDGVIPGGLALIDEGHRMPGMGLYRLWKGKLRKRQAQIMLTSTAGEPGSEFEEMRNNVKDKARNRVLRSPAHIRFEGRGIVMNEWMVRKAEDASDPVKVKEANPLEQITAEELAEDLDSPTVDMGDWKRLKCNIPSRSQNAAISDGEWEGSEMLVELPPGSHLDLGCDVAWKHDTFAITPCGTVGRKVVKVFDKRTKKEKLLDRPVRLLGEPEILVPPRDGSTLHPDFVKDAFDRFIDNYVVDTVIMDMERAEDIASWLEDERGVRVVDWSKGNAQAAKDYESFMRGLRQGTLRHVRHAGLTAHAMHAIARSLPGDKKRFDRPTQSRAKKKQDERVIDALDAGAMVHSYLDDPPELEGQLPGDVSDYRITRIG